LKKQDLKFENLILKYLRERKFDYEEGGWMRGVECMYLILGNYLKEVKTYFEKDNYLMLMIYQELDLRENFGLYYYHY